MELLDIFRRQLRNEEEMNRFVELMEALTVVERVGEKGVVKLRKEWRALVEQWWT